MIFIISLFMAEPMGPSISASSLEEHARVRAQNIMKIDEILSSIEHGNIKAFERAGVAGVPYYVGGSSGGKTASFTKFTINSLFPLAGCKRSLASWTSFNWYRVSWNCPGRTSFGWHSVATAFKFDGFKVVEVRTVPGLPTITKAERVKPIDRENWVYASDYPVKLKGVHAIEKVRVALTVSPNGDATACKVLFSSGDAELDAGTCDLLMKRAHFIPAQDMSGRPVGATYETVVAWFV
jgi:TonB family protein